MPIPAGGAVIVPGKGGLCAGSSRAVANIALGSCLEDNRSPTHEPMLIW